MPSASSRPLFFPSLNALTVKISNHFDVRELVPPEVFQIFGENSAWFVSPQLLQVLDLLRFKLARPIIVNDWHVGGQYKYSGFRPRHCSIGAAYSMHRMGLAADIKVQGLSPKDMLAAVLDSRNVLMPLGLSTVENINFTPTWLHIDCRPRTERHPVDGFLIVDPS